MEDNSYSSNAFEFEQTHHSDEPTLGDTGVPYSHQNQHDQLPEPAQLSYQAEQAGPTPFGPMNPQTKSTIPNTRPNRPTPFPPQPVMAHPVQTVPVNSWGPQPRTINPPGPNPNTGSPYHGSPNPVIYPATNSVPSGLANYPGGPNPGQLNGAPQYGIPFGTEAWRTGLFDCMEDPMNALITAFVPCVTFGQVAEIIDNGHTSCATSGIMYGAVAFCIAMPCILSCTYRTKLRSKFNLMETPAPDWVTHFLCECCALCQEYRELQRRGLDPSIGYHANVAKGQAAGFPGEVNMTPPMHHRMMA